MMVVVKAAVKLLHDVHYLRLFTEWVHDTDAFRQLAGVCKMGVKIDDVICEGHFHEAKVGK